MENKVVCDDLDYLQELSIFKDKVNFKIHSEDYTIMESYQQIKLDKSEGSGCIIIEDSKGYDNRITDYTIKLDDDTNSIISYKGEGPAIFTYTKPITRSTKNIINRESKSIGYKASTGELQNATKVIRHMMFNKLTDKPLYMTKEFYRGDQSTDENPPLNTIFRVEFDQNSFKDNDPTFKGREEITLFDKYGNIENYTVSENTYAETISGEIITLNVDYKFTSSDDYKKNIIPKLKIEEDGRYAITYYQKENPFIELAKEVFIVDENNLLIITLIENQFGTTTFSIKKDNSFDYNFFTNINNNHYSILGNVKYPLAGDIFMVNEYKGIVSFSMRSYFNNIYETDNALDCYMNENILNKVIIRETDINGKEYNYDFGYDQYGIINNLKMISVNDDYSSYKESKLPNGNKIIESCINAEPISYPINKKSIFYRAVEIGNNNGIDYIVSDYRALIVNHKDFID